MNYLVNYLFQKQGLERWACGSVAENLPGSIPSTKKEKQILLYCPG